MKRIFSGLALFSILLASTGGKVLAAGDPLPTVRPNLDVWGIAHRGASDTAPENTLPAYQQTIDAGFGFIEIDVHYTRDGVPVCLHDAAVDRTSNGSGPIFLMSLKEIKKLDAGSWFGEEFTGVEIPTLEEALQIMQGKIGLYLDQKDKARPVLIELLKKYGFLPHKDNLVIVGTGEYAQSFRDLYADAPAMAGCAQVDCIESAIEDFPSIYAFNISASVATPEFVEAAHAHGMRVFCNVFGRGDNHDTIRRVLMSGVDAMQTNNPAIVNEVLDIMRKEVEEGKLQIEHIPAAGE